MILELNLRFASQYGQTVYVTGNTDELGAGDLSKAIPMQYRDAQTWHVSIELDPVNEIRYKYVLRTEGNGQIIQPVFNLIQPADLSVKLIYALDEWNNPGDIQNAFLTQPFQKVYSKVPDSRVRNQKKITHFFKVYAPLLLPHESICLTGSGETLGNWEADKLHLLKYHDGQWQLAIKIKEEQYPIAYKYGIYNNNTGSFAEYEQGDNRVIPLRPKNDAPLYLHDAFVRVQNRIWKGAGVAIPVFSLRTKNGFGTGEFSDIKLLTDWAQRVGMKIIQLLPVNDTTATHTNKDSYPYAAISAFALHPLYINLEKTAGKELRTLVKYWNRKKTQFNKEPAVDYEHVMRFKMAALKEIFALRKEEFLKEAGFQNFFDQNKHWLVPYAAFCYLRDKYGTADAFQWKSNSRYEEAAIKQLCTPSQKHYDEIAFTYFVQYHLHLQLQEATDYAHKKGIAIKGDLPIGVYRFGADVWQEPDEFYMDEQAGAPPDDFAVHGQNWGFPTYNWKKMQEDGFAWWQRRFNQMGLYFDAFRIDHILGFFRMWSIPLHSVEGIMGRFIPAIPIHINELFQRQIQFTHTRYCKPFITEELLAEKFGSDVQVIRELFFDGLSLKPEFQTQRAVVSWFAKEPEWVRHQQALFDIISNVILFDEGDGEHFHFRFGSINTDSFRMLDDHAQKQLNELYINYFFRRQDEFWQKQAMNKLPGLKAATNMLVCGEDLGMVPDCVPGVMKELGIISLEIQRMPKKVGIEFMHPNDAPYACVITPSTHDMSTIRGWWEEDPVKTQRFYNQVLGKFGEAPVYCEPYINEQIVLQHLYSPAMFCIFQMQDILGCSAGLRRENPNEERINIPADPNHFWNYRMHISLEDLILETEFNNQIRLAIEESGR